MEARAWLLSRTGSLAPASRKLSHLPIPARSQMTCPRARCLHRHWCQPTVLPAHVHGCGAMFSSCRA
eukprot:364266-Chlamydomonas_euryale.AAC.8